MRRGAKISIRINVVPDAARKDSEKELLQSFEPPAADLSNIALDVLKNRDYSHSLISKSELDEAERVFFSNGVWALLPSDQTGKSMNREMS